MYLCMKSYLKSNRNHTVKYTLNRYVFSSRFLVTFGEREMNWGFGQADTVAFVNDNTV
jgi:hypothetical protein